MPNWCSNALLWEGDSEQVKAFEEKLSTIADDGLLGTFFPMPEELGNKNTVYSEGKKYLAPIDPNNPLGMGDKDTYQELTPELELELIAKYGASDWYDWSVRNWGTKWNVLERDMLRIKQNHIVFDTAWAPPEPWIRTVSQNYPSLTFTLAFCEGGVSYWGVLQIRDGELLHEEGGDQVWRSATDQEWEDYDDVHDMLSPEVYDHVEKYQIGVGG